jgi:hypothetical protein
LLRQLFQQCLSLLQVGGGKDLGEPAVDRCRSFASFISLALALPQLTQAQGRQEFPRLGLLAAGHGHGLLSAGFRLGRVRDGLPQEQLPVEPVHLCFILTHSSVVHHRQCFGQ